jgi:hypothetical protein
VVLSTGKTGEKRQVSRGQWQHRRSQSSTVFRELPRSLRIPVAARLLPDGVGPDPRNHNLIRPPASAQLLELDARRPAVLAPHLFAWAVAFVIG